MLVPVEVSLLGEFLFPAGLPLALLAYLSIQLVSGAGLTKTQNPDTRTGPRFNQVLVLTRDPRILHRKALTRVSTSTRVNDEGIFQA